MKTKKVERAGNIWRDKKETVKTSSTGIWILYLKIIIIQQQKNVCKKYADVKKDSTGSTAHCADIIQPEP